MTEAGCGGYTIPTECSQDELFYKTYHQAGGRRGTCLIINIKNVPGQEPRWGTEQDCKKIQEVFADVLRFDIDFKNDRTKKELECALLECSEAIGKDLSSDCFACFVLSHGDDDFILCGDGQKFNTQDIFAYFTDEACPSLAGKPKFFFLQSCRGKGEDKMGSPLSYADSSMDTNKSLHTPHDDFYVFYCTSRGQKGFRTEFGSYFIQYICEVVLKQHRRRSFQAMMTLVKKHMGDLEIQRDVREIVKQMPHETSTLTKKFRFAPEPQPLHVIVPSTSERNQYELKSELFKNSLWKEFEGLPVVVILVTGIVRPGTSSLVDYMIRYLEHLESNPSPENWMGDPKKPLEGFSWQYGLTTRTRGIFLFDRIFKVKLSSGTVAVVLMDTEGCSKKNTDAQSTLFSLSMLLSSTIVYNVRHDLHQTGVENLQFYANYASHVKENLKDSEENLSCGESQKLLFLIRDWINKDLISYGFDAERKAIGEWLQHDEEAEGAVKMWKNVRDNIKDIAFFLMPSPGESIKSAKVDGGTKGLSEDFKRNLDALCRHVFHPDNLVPRSIKGRDFTFKDFTVLFKIYFQMAKEWKLPPAPLLYSVTMFLHNTRVLQDIQKSHESDLEQRLLQRKSTESVRDLLKAARSQLNPNHLLQNATELVGNSSTFPDQIHQMMDTSYRAIDSALGEAEKIARDSDQCKEQLSEADALYARLDVIARNYEKAWRREKKTMKKKEDIEEAHESLKEEALSKLHETSHEKEDRQRFVNLLRSKIEYSYASMAKPVLTTMLDAEIQQLESQRNQLSSARRKKFKKIRKIDDQIEEKKQNRTKGIEEMEKKRKEAEENVGKENQEIKIWREEMTAQFKKMKESQPPKNAEEYRNDMQRIYIDFMKQQKVDLDEVDKQKLADDLISDDSFLSKTLGYFLALYKRTEPNASRQP
ncbi:uncharacterized protein LOC135378915 [Ornithodoros turicata]|uniref:uncharacterized protein LOC135378915 n=1 Tax=Ornithodoros turicata TaxID=34597 RepID=UPI0031389A94